MRSESNPDRADDFNLERFVEAQSLVYQQVTSELRAARKTSHWMWFVFPQIGGLGRSLMAMEYGISGLEEARAYLAHAVLGARLKECTDIVLRVENRSAALIFGSPDDMKFRSCMTLFAEVSPDNDIFTRALQKYFDGVPDRMTIERIRSIISCR